MKTDTDPVAEAFRNAFGSVVEPAIDAPAWATLAERAAAVGSEETSPRPGFLRQPVVVAAVAAVAVLAAIGGALLVIRADGDPAPSADSNPHPVPTTLDVTTTSPGITTDPAIASTVEVPDASASVFEWGDDLSDWVTEAEMTDALVSLLGADAAPRAVLDHEPGDDEWRWTLAGWRVYAHDGAHGNEEFEPPTATDPRLEPGVTFEAAEGFAHGFYILSGPNSDESICMTLFPPGTSFGYPDESEVGVHEDRVFALASTMLREMGWAD